jgi:hypothetical protein
VEAGGSAIQRKISASLAFQVSAAGPRSNVRYAQKSGLASAWLSRSVCSHEWTFERLFGNFDFSLPGRYSPD